MPGTMNSDFKYELSIRWSPEESAFTVTIPELPGCITMAIALKKLRLTQEAISVYVESLTARGLPIPTPLSLTNQK